MKHPSNTSITEFVKYCSFPPLPRQQMLSPSLHTLYYIPSHSAPSAKCVFILGIQGTAAMCSLATCLCHDGSMAHLSLFMIQFTLDLVKALLLTRQDVYIFDYGHMQFPPLGFSQSNYEGVKHPNAYIVCVLHNNMTFAVQHQHVNQTFVQLRFGQVTVSQ